MDSNEVRHVAHLSRIHLSEEELGRFTAQLGEILTSFHKLSELDTEGVEPMTYAVEVRNVFRTSSDRHELSREDALANAPLAEDGFFCVPRTFGERGGPADEEGGAEE